MFFKNLDYAAGWLAGIIDGEGCVTCDMERKKGRRRVLMCNTDPEIVRAIDEVLQLFGIRYYKGVKRPKNPKWKLLHSFQVSDRVSLEILFEILNLASDKKQLGLARAVKSFKNRKLNWKLIVELYRKKEFSQSEIAKMFGVSQGRISRIIRSRGAEISDSEKMRRAWKKRDRASFGNKMRAYWDSRTDEFMNNYKARVSESSKQYYLEHMDEFKERLKNRNRDPQLCLPSLS